MPRIRGTITEHFIHAESIGSFLFNFTWIALFITGLCFVGPGSASPLRELFNHDLPVWSYPLFLQNFSMASQQAWGPAWMVVTWSLAVEEQFYLLLPLLVRNLSWRRTAWVVVASIFCAPLVRIVLSLSGNQIIGPYTLLPSRADALGFGVLVALACRDKRAWEWFASHRRYLHLAFLLMACGLVFLLKHEGYLYTFGLTWIAAFYALLLLLTVVGVGRAETSCFRTKILVSLGTVAYAVYIFHLPINVLFHFAFFGRLPIINNWSSLSVTVSSLITVMFLAALSWRILEKPLIRHAHAIYHY